MFFDPEGKPERVVGFMLDVNERHQAEDRRNPVSEFLRSALDRHGG